MTSGVVSMERERQRQRETETEKGCISEKKSDSLDKIYSMRALMGSQWRVLRMDEIMISSYEISARESCS